MTNIKDLLDGKIAHASIFGLLTDITQKETRNGSSFVIITISDGKNELQAKMWDTKRSDIPYDTNSIVCMTVDASPYNGVLGFTASRIRAATPEDGVSEEDFIASAPVPAQEMYDFIMDTINSFSNESLRNIAAELYEENKEKLLIWPTAKRMHHNIRGGLLYHVYRMLISAESACKAYQNTDEEMIKAGIILHDIGKLREMTAGELGTGEYTAEGNLFGHLYLGTKMVEDCGERMGADKATVMHLAHIVASHHGKREFGAIVIPQTTEAYIVSELDMLDAQLYVYEKADEELSSGEFTNGHYKF